MQVAEQERVPGVLVPARRPARARAGAAVHAAGARRSRSRSRSSGRARARGCARCSRRVRAALAIGALYAINSWSYPVMAGVFVGRARRSGCATRASRAGGAALGALGAARAGAERRADAAVLPLVRPGRATGSGWSRTAARSATSWPTRRCSTGCARRSWRSPTRAGCAAQREAVAQRRLVRGAAIVGGSLLAPLGRPGRRVGPGAAARGRAARGAAAAAWPAPERVLWLLIAGGLALRADPRDRLRARRVRRLDAVPHEHRLQARLPGVAAAGARRDAGAVRLAVRVGAARGCGWAGGSRSCCSCCSRSRIRGRARTRARTASSRRRRSTACGWLRARRPGDAGAIDWLRANAPGDAVVLEAVGRRLLARSATGASRRSPASRPCIGWGGHEVQWEHDPGDRCSEVAAVYTATDAQVAPRADRPLRRSTTSSSGRSSGPTYGDAGLAKWDTARAARVRPRRHDRLGRSSGARALVEPLGHAARGVPHLALA